MGMWARRLLPSPSSLLSLRSEEIGAKQKDRE